MIYDSLENLAHIDDKLSHHAAITSDSISMPLLSEEIKNFLLKAQVCSYEEICAAKDDFAGLDLRFNDYETKPAAEIPFEAHKKLWDLQIVFEGEEVLTVLPLSEMTETVPYDETKDISFYSGTGGTDVLLKAGYAAVLAPWDGHRPGADTKNGKSHIKKIVIKFIGAKLPREDETCPNDSCIDKA